MAARFTNVSGVPLAIAVFLASDYYDHDEDPFTISATSLLKPPRQLILASRIAPGEALPDLPSMMNNRMGAAIHDSIEKAWLTNYAKAMAALGYPQKVIDKVAINPSKEYLQLFPEKIPVYLEQRLVRQLGKWKITGKFDFVGEGRVQDFKSTSVWTYKNQVNNDKYILQGSIYRWLDSDLITQDRMDIHYIFTDWKPTFQKTDPNYPSRRFLTQSFDLLSTEATEAYIRRKIKIIEDNWSKPEAELPQCTDEELWRTEPSYKYYKNPEKTLRSTKNFDTHQEAMLEYVKDGSVGLIKEIPGQVVACKYCPAFTLCQQKDQLIASGDLVL